MVGFDGNSGMVRLLAAIAAALFLKVITGVGPALAPAEENDDDGENEESTAEEEGGGVVVPVSIRWSGITCSLSDKRGKTVRFLLTNVSGEAKPGRLLAIMGPSGSGKTTLLNVLAGQLAASPRLHLSGHLDVNGRPRSSGGHRIAYVRQEDLFFSQLTVRETLSLAAELQLPDIQTAEKRDEYVNKLLFRLGLINCADSIVGDAKVRGISGGEKKRLALGCELIASPSIIFADEPTTVLHTIMDPSTSLGVTSSAAKKRKFGFTQPVSSKKTFTPQLALMNEPHTDDAMNPAAEDEMNEPLFLERTCMALDINPAYINRLENRRELGYYANPANRRLDFTTLNLEVTEIRRCIAQVLTRALRVRYHDRSNLRDSEITAELAIIVPLTVSACMCAIYAKLHAIHCQHGRLSTRYPTSPHYNKEIELPLPLAIAIQELGIFQTASLEQNVILAPTYPEATQYEGRAEDNFNITDYLTFIPIYKDLGIPCKSVDPNVKKGSAWWTYHIRNAEGTTDLICTIPPTCYTELAASIRMLFLATQDNVATCAELIAWPEQIPDFGTHLRESPPNSNTRAFLALCHGSKEEWSLGHV